MQKHHCEIYHIPTQDFVAYRDNFTLIFFIIKAWKRVEETHLKRRLNKIWVCQISFDFFTFY